MSRAKKIFFLCFMFFGSSSFIPLPSSLVSAAVPHLINYQGRLTDSSGSPLTGSYDVTFRIYDAQAAGNLLWQEAHAGVVVDKGVFSVLLGSITSLNLPFDKQYYLEIKVAEEVMSPRQSITSSGYAIRAEEAEVYNGPGKVGFKAVDEANIGDGKVLVYNATTGKLNYADSFTYMAGTTMVKNNDTEVSTRSTGYVQVQQLGPLRYGGTLTIKFDLKRGSAGGSVHARVYRNGAAVGTACQHTAGNTYATYSQDIAGWSAGDLLQIYAQDDDGYWGAWVKNVRAYTGF